MADNRLTKCLSLVIALSIAAGCGGQRVLSKGQRLYDAGKYHEAIEVFRSLASDSSEIAEQAQLYLGFANFKLGRHGQAIDGFRAVTQRFPSSEWADDAFYWLGRCYEDWGKRDEAIAAYRNAAETVPPSGKANMALRASEAIDRLEAEWSAPPADSGGATAAAGNE